MLTTTFGDGAVRKLKGVNRVALARSTKYFEFSRIYDGYAAKSSNKYKAPFNRIKNVPRVYTPEDKAIQMPNSDTPYSFAGLDLRAEPIVLTLPGKGALAKQVLEFLELAVTSFEEGDVQCKIIFPVAVSR